MKKLFFFVFTFFFNHLVQADGVNLLSDRLNCSNTYSLCQSCSNNQYLFPLQKFSNNMDALEIEADNSEIINQGDYLISGDVSVRSTDNFLSADKVIISKENKSSTASGSVKYQDEDFLLAGENLKVVRQENSELNIDVSNAKYQELKTKANGKASFINKVNNIARLENSTYSFCPINNNSWFIKADQIKLDLENNRTLATNAKLVFFDVPILYLPKYSWVSSGKGSGFLSPGFNFYKESGSDSTEFQTRLPYYFDIAPDRDLLTAISYLSSRGTVIEGEYRQLLGKKTKDDGLFQIKTNYLFKDKIKKTNRWLLDSSIELEVNNNVHLSVKYNKVSDSNYYKDVLKSQTEVERLKSYVKTEFNYPPLPELKDSGKLDNEKIITVNYGRNKLNSNLNLSQKSYVLSAESEQVVNHGIPDYTKGIEASIFSRKKISESSPVIDLGIVSSKFNHKSAGKDTGIRTHAELSIANNLGSIKFFKSSQLTSNAKLGLTNYSLLNRNNENRLFGSFDLDLAFPSYKNLSLFGTSVRREIRPAISYDYTSKHNQSSIPIFDTTDTIDNILTYSTLRSGERYSGIDRFINKNDITLSLKSTYTELKKPNNTRLDFKLAQRYYGDKDAVSDALNTNFENRRKYSDVAASLDISLDDYDRLESKLLLQIDPKTFKVSKNQLGLTYKIHDRKFVSLTHKDNGSSRTLNLSGAYPISNRIHFFGGLEKSLKTGITNKQTSGIAYEDCCWSARIGHFKEAFVDNVAKYDYSTGFELVFKGLGSTDTNLRNHIETNLPEYKVSLSKENIEAKVLK